MTTYQFIMGTIGILIGIAGGLYLGYKKGYEVGYYDGENQRKYGSNQVTLAGIFDVLSALSVIGVVVCIGIGVWMDIKDRENKKDEL